MFINYRKYIILVKNICISPVLNQNISPRVKNNSPIMAIKKEEGLLQMHHGIFDIVFSSETVRILSIVRMKYFMSQLFNITTFQSLHQFTDPTYVSYFLLRSYIVPTVQNYSKSQAICNLELL